MASIRTTAPSYSNKYYIVTSAGGLNECIEISGGSALPNCVGYCWGAWYEMMGTRPSLSRNNAERWYDTNDGYSRGSTPKLGAVACWKDSKYPFTSNTNGGHVAIVYEYGDGYIKVAQSNYGGARFELATYTTDSTGTYAWMVSDTYPNGTHNRLTFQGFIYYDGEPEPPTPTKCTVTLYVEPDGAGTVTGAGSYDIGDTATITATANKGYEFISWSDGYENTLRYWKMDYLQDVVLTAIFKKKGLKGTLQDTFIIKALKVLHGDYGNGINREKALGDDYKQVQLLVNRLILCYGLYDRLAMQVWIGLWGTGTRRKLALTKAGYNYTKVQEHVKKFKKTSIVLKY